MLCCVRALHQLKSEVDFGGKDSGRCLEFSPGCPQVPYNVPVGGSSIPQDAISWNLRNCSFQSAEGTASSRNSTCSELRGADGVVLLISTLPPRGPPGHDAQTRSRCC